MCSGGVARSILSRNKCDKCRDLLTAPKDYLHIDADDEEEDDDQMEFVDDEEAARIERESYQKQVDRGGLIVASELVYFTCVSAFKLKRPFLLTMSSKLLFRASNPRKVFIMCFER